MHTFVCVSFVCVCAVHVCARVHDLSQKMCVCVHVQFALGSTIYVHDVIVRRSKDLCVYNLLCYTWSST